MNEFAKYHPLVNLAYFVAVLGFSMVFMHPFALTVSITSGFIYSVILTDGKSLKFSPSFVLPLFLAAVLLNPVFNHKGITILCYLPWGSPLTLEAIIYGIAAGVMLASIICHFSCFNKVMTSDKLVYLFSRLAPALSLIFSMVLRFVPMFRARLKTLAAAQSYIGHDMSKGSIISRAKKGIRLLSIMVSWSLESSIDTADSMKSRGYGLPDRSAYSNFCLAKRDVVALLFITLLSGYIIGGGIKGALRFVYFPGIAPIKATPYTLSVFGAYVMLFIFPIILETEEVLKWKKLKSGI